MLFDMAARPPAVIRGLRTPHRARHKSESAAAATDNVWNTEAGGPQTRVSARSAGVVRSIARISRVHLPHWAR